jgi:lipopolysaccharide/colanic/teichoic acid biosynthesis glycosyltransferase
MLLKRGFDFIVAAILIVAFSWLLLVVALAVRVAMGRPLLFLQRRPGLHGRPFTILKFRTMVDARDDAGNLLPDDARLTRFGRLLRKSSLDELPSLFNVLRGEMSLVGPRPLLMEYLGRYSAEQMRRHEVPPGVTGLAQIRGRNAIGWEERLALDVYYVDHRSFWLDLKILAATGLALFKVGDVNAPGHATMPVFTGSPRSASK